MLGLRERKVDTVPPGEFHSDFSISSLQEQDLPEFLKVLTAAIRDIPGMSAEEVLKAVENKNVSTYTERLEDPDSFLYVAKNRQGKIVGVLEGKLAHYDNAPEEYRTLGYTAWTGVDREYRGKGVAQALKTTYENTCRGMGLYRMQTFVKDVNAPSILMNSRMGYQPDAHFPPGNGGKTYTKKL